MSVKPSIMEGFPLDKPRTSQIEVLRAIQHAFDKGYRNVLLEAPVGSGKSAIAVACAKYFKEAHVLTPRKSLQDQYAEDFYKESLVTMKGRSSYPCTYPSDGNQEYDRVTSLIRSGKPLVMLKGTKTCNEGPCITSGKIKKLCTNPGDNGQPDRTPCPYSMAIDTAQISGTIVHNLHSFIFQTYYSGRFQKRPLLVVDECHELEDTLRGFAEKTITIPVLISEQDMPLEGNMTTMADWADYLLPFADRYSSNAKEGEVSAREEFEALILTLQELSDIVGDKFVVDSERDTFSKKTKFIITPEYVANLSGKYILDYGERRLLMSGTVYSKNLYCRLNGLIPEETCFIKIGSSFPKRLRPIYAKQEYMVDTSHKMWDTNFSQVVANIRKVMEIFKDVKGLIHAPSYTAAIALQAALRDSNRVVTHSKDDFQQVLQAFYSSAEPKVLISPICQQGVDFREDRARFQIILRVPYPSTSSKLMAKKVKEDFSYYNYKALVVFGQQIGRVNRSEEDFGVTILMDSRFPGFLRKNKTNLPKWLMEAVVYE